MKHFTLILTALLAALPLAAQKYEKAVLPLDLPVSFSGTYAELRHNHFHAGLDFRTGGVEGHPVHAIKDGYISRISVSPTGYGNGIYITHRDGTMSVYGHLQKFTDAVARKVLDTQYARKSYKIDIYPEAGEYPVKAGDVIGLSGNTGSSGGPHLHMEVRLDGGNLPIDYLAHGVYEVSDTQSPVIRKIAVYAYEDSTMIPDMRKLRTLRFTEENIDVIKVPTLSYIAIDAVDRMAGLSYSLAVSRYEVLVDSEPLYDFKLGDISYSEQKYIQSAIQFGETGADMIKTLVEPGNGLDYKIDAVNDGLIVLEDYDIHKVTVRVYDWAGNSASQSFRIQRDDSVQVRPEGGNDGRAELLWYLPNTLDTGSMTFTVPKGALYNSCYADFKMVAEANPEAGIYTDVWQIGTDKIPTHTSPTLSVEVDRQFGEKGRKMYIATWNGGKLAPAWSSYKNGRLTAKTGFGTYCVALDTIAPVATVRLPQGGQIPASGEFVIDAEDRDSGLKSFYVELDGKWVLSYIKGKKLHILLDSTHHSRGQHDVKVTLEDMCLNKSEKYFKIIW